MSAFDLAAELGHEELLLLQDHASGLNVVVAIHDTSLGPAAGGTRMRSYPSLDAAAVDALRLARAMTYKAAMAGVARGGGKAVILGDPRRDKSRALLQAYARVLDRFGGRFTTGGDLGIDERDVAVMARVSRYVSHVPQGASVDASDLTAIGVLEAIRCVAELLERRVDGLHVAVQGLGQVGYRLARRLNDLGARLTVTDADPSQVERAQAELQARAAGLEEIYGVACDVFSPNAVGGILDHESVAGLQCRAVVGAANEQLADPAAGDRLHERGILYAPDYVVNAGGLLSLLFEQGETDELGVIERVRQIGPRVVELLRRAGVEAVPPQRLADRVVEEKLEAARAARRLRDRGPGLPEMTPA